MVDTHGGRSIGMMVERHGGQWAQYLIGMVVDRHMMVNWQDGIMWVSLSIHISITLADKKRFTFGLVKSMLHFMIK